MQYNSVEHRKKVAEKYGLDEQEIIDLPKDKFEILISGLEIGEKYGAKKVIDYIRKEFNDDKKQ